MSTEAIAGGLTAGAGVMLALGWLWARINGHDRKWQEHNVCHMAIERQLGSIATNIDTLLREVQRLRNGGPE